MINEDTSNAFQISVDHTFFLSFFDPTSDFFSLHRLQSNIYNRGYQSFVLQCCEFEEASCRTATCSLRSKKFCWEVAKSKLQKWQGFGQRWGPCTPIWHPLILHWHHHIGRSVQIPSHKIITVVVNRWASELSQWLHKRKRKKKCSWEIYRGTPLLFDTFTSQ